MKIRSCWHPTLGQVLFPLSDEKSPKQRQTTPVLPIAIQRPFHRVFIDCLGPFPVTNSGIRCLVVFSDYSTRFPEAFAVPTCDTATIVDLLVNETISPHGAPRTQLLDRGSNFLSSVVIEVCYLMHTNKAFSTSYHPQCDGLVVRFSPLLVFCILVLFWNWVKCSILLTNRAFWRDMV